MELKIICREVDKNTGRIAVYPIDTKVTDELIFKLRLRSRMNPELKYYAVELCYWLQNNEKIKSILRSKNPDAKVRKDGGAFEI